MNPILRYECDECGTTHDRLEFAEDCCHPNVNEVYECIECGTDYSDKAECEECCKEDEDA